MAASEPITEPPANRPRRANRGTDISEELAEIGLSDKTGWYTSVAFYTLGGVLTVVGGLIVPETVTTSAQILGGVSLVFAVFCFWGARNLVSRTWGVHLRMGMAVTIMSVGGVTTGEHGYSMILLTMLLLTAPCYVYGSRFAIPYSAWGLALTLYVVLRMNGENEWAHGVVTIGTITMLIAGLMVSEQRTRSLARLNRRLAYTDPLTGIANTRKLRETLTAALVDEDPSRREFALFAMDLDNFKLVNDIFEHTTGDLVLKGVAEEIASELEPDDLAVRRGGDEFSVFVPAADGRDLDELRNRLAQAIRRARNRVCPSISPTGGVAYVIAGPDDTLASIMRRADDELHEVKKAFHELHGDRESIGRTLTQPEINRIRRHGLSIVSDPVGEAPRERGPAAGVIAAMRDGILRLNPVWGFVAFTFIPIGGFNAALAAAGLLRPLDPVIGASLNVGIAAVGILAVVAGRRGLSRRWIHPAYIVAVGLFVAMFALAGPAGAALFDSFCVPMIYALYFFPGRVAAVYFLAVNAAMYFFAFTGGYPDATVHAIMNGTVVLAMAALILKVRKLTVGFARANRELSEIDALTGLANVRALRSRVKTAIELAGDAEPRPALIALDLDKFKLVNDTFNHTIGDQVLAAVAHAIEETVRAEDLVARRGGDEFVVLCSVGGETELYELSKRIATAIVHARHRICPEIMATASIAGVVLEPGEHTDDFLQRADRALHDEKSAVRESGYRARAVA